MQVFPQGSILGPLLFLIYINNLSEGLSSNAKLFAGNTSLFSVIHDSNTSALELNSDMAKINRWAFPWKMSFNPDPKKQAHEVIFSRKSKAILHTPAGFNNNNVIQATSQKHLGILVYNVYLAITGAIRGSSREILYQELNFLSLQQRRWCRKLCSLYKVFKRESPRYLHNIIPIRNPSYITRNHANIPLFKTNHDFFHKTFFFHLCKCGIEVETTSYFLLHRLIYNNDRSSLLSNIRNIDCKLLKSTDTSLTQTLLYGSPSLVIITILLILNATVDFILTTKRFEE